MNKSPRPERKKRIKKQNADREGKRQIDQMSPEEFDRRMEGLHMMFIGLLRFTGIDPVEIFRNPIERDSKLEPDSQQEPVEWPEEINTEGK